MNATTFSVTRFTTTSPSRLSKAFRLEFNTLIKESGGQMFSGVADRITVDLAGFADLLSSLDHRQALAYGVNGHESARVVPSAKLTHHLTNQPTIARDREHFAWPLGAGVLMIDYDVPPDGQSREREALLQSLYSVWPGLESAPHIWRASAGSCIHRTDTGEVLKGISGQRVYVVVSDAAAIPEAGALLFDRLWLAGFGRFEVSKSGSLLARTLIDGAVFQPERLDFCGGAECGPGLEQRLPPPMVFNSAADPLDCASLPPLSKQEAAELRQIKGKAAALMAAEVSQKRAAWVNARVMEALEALPPERRTLEQRATFEDAYTRACIAGRLLADFTLTLEKHGTVTVGAILDNPSRYHGCRTLDPLEPDYNGGRFTGWLNVITAGRPYLWSHAHGGQRFTLHRALQTLRIEPGELHSMADKALDSLRLDGSIYQRGPHLVRIGDDLIHPIGSDWIALYLNRLCRFEKFDSRAKKWVPDDCPSRLATSICAMSGEWRLPELRGVVSAPYIAPSGRVVESDGYEAETGLVLDFKGVQRWTPIHQRPSVDQVRSAARALWKPFKDFPFVGPVDRGVFMAALLTAIQRPTLPTAPGFSLDAPTAGSGKTLLALCLCRLAGAPSPEIMPPLKGDDDNEIRKRLFAACLAGARTILFDNATGQVESPALCAFLTAETFADRILGKSENAAAPTTSLVLVTGNNLSMVGDLNRRILRARIDPEDERPHRRKFDLNPSVYVKENRLRLVQAGLTILRGYRQSGETPADSMASFEDWSDLIRGAVVWLGALLENDQGRFFGDPAESIDKTYSDDPERARLGALLIAWDNAFGISARTIGEAIREADLSKTTDSSFFDALDDISGGRGGLNGKAIRWYLQRMAGRIVNGLRFRRGEDDKHAKQARWRVEHVKSAGLAGLCGLTPNPTRETVKLPFSIEPIGNKPAYTRINPQSPFTSTGVAVLSQHSSMAGKPDRGEP